jgi:hypothetical protein
LWRWMVYSRATTSARADRPAFWVLGGAISVVLKNARKSVGNSTAGALFRIRRAVYVPRDLWRFVVESSSRGFAAVVSFVGSASSFVNIQHTRQRFEACALAAFACVTVELGLGPGRAAKRAKTTWAWRCVTVCEPDFCTTTGFIPNQRPRLLATTAYGKSFQLRRSIWYLLHQ